MAASSSSKSSPAPAAKAPAPKAPAPKAVVTKAPTIATPVLGANVGGALKSIQAVVNKATTSTKPTVTTTAKPVVKVNTTGTSTKPVTNANIFNPASLTKFQSPVGTPAAIKEAAAKSNPVNTKGFSSASGGGGTSSAPAPKSMFEPIATSPVSTFKLPDYRNPVATSQGVSQAPVAAQPKPKYDEDGNIIGYEAAGRQLSPRDIKAVEAKIVAAGKNAGAMSTTLKQQLEAAGIDTSFIKQDYSKEANRIMENARMLAQNKIQGQQSDPATAKLLSTMSIAPDANAKKKAEEQALLASKSAKAPMSTAKLDTGMSIAPGMSTAGDKSNQLDLSNPYAVLKGDKTVVGTDVSKLGFDANKIAGGQFDSNKPTVVAGPTETIYGEGKDQYTSFSAGEARPFTFPGKTTAETTPAPTEGTTTPPATTTSPDTTKGGQEKPTTTPGGTPAPETTPAPVDKGGKTPAPVPPAPDTNTPPSKILSQAEYDKAVADAVATGKSEEDVKSAMEKLGYTVGGNVVAPNGKQYEIIKGADGRYGFVNVKGEMQFFDNYNAAKGYIDINNPIGKGDPTKLGPNVLKPKGETPLEGTPDEIALATKTKAENEKKKQAQKDALDLIKQQEAQNAQDMQDAGDATYKAKSDIIQASVQGLQDTYTKIDSFMTDLENKSKELFDMGAARSANARAMAMANKGYLTSDQVAQVANYSMADYRREADLKRVDIEKQIAEKKMELATTKNKLQEDIRSNQMLNEDSKLAQINKVEETFNNLLTQFADKEVAVKQFYDSQIGSIDSMGIQTKLGSTSLIQQDDAKNVIQQNNKARAMQDDTARTSYIMSKLTDANLSPFVYKVIDGLMQRGTYMSNANIEAQAAAIITAANYYYQQSLLSLKK